MLVLSSILVRLSLIGRYVKLQTAIWQCSEIYLLHSHFGQHLQVKCHVKLIQAEAVAEEFFNDHGLQ